MTCVCTKHSLRVAENPTEKGMLTNSLRNVPRSSHVNFGKHVTKRQSVTRYQITLSRPFC